MLFSSGKKLLAFDCGGNVGSDPGGNVGIVPLDMVGTRVMVSFDTILGCKVSLDI